MNRTATRSRRKTPADFHAPAEVFKALSNANRLLIVDALRDGEANVASLTGLVGLDMSTVSGHLTVLRSVGIVGSERRGTQIFYTLQSPCILKLFACMDEFRDGKAH